MSRKIIFIGPPEAGKTTLRKIFFEGENSKSLLEQGIEPTYGKESINLNLEDMIGIFDLSGQENYRWIKTDDSSVFYNVNAIIVIIDAKTPIHEIVEFSKKIVEKRNELAPQSKIYLLIHKIDLVNHSRIENINKQLVINYSTTDKIEFFYTTIKEKEGYFHTLFIFVNILKECLGIGLGSDNLEFDLMKLEFKILSLLNDKLSIPRNELVDELSISKENRDLIIDRLIDKGLTQYSSSEGTTVITFTEKGKDFFNKLSTHMQINEINKLGDRLNLKTLIPEKEIPVFIGYLISDKNGIMITRVDIFDEAIEQFLWSSGRAPEVEEFKDINLIPMFINAIEKFSLEINMKDLSGFMLEGTNVKIEILNVEDYSIIFFLNPSTNIKSFMNQIIDYFIDIFTIYSDDFSIFHNTGDLSKLKHLKVSGRKWLVEITKSYNNKMLNLEMFDLETAKALMIKLDDLYEDIKLKTSRDIDTIKKLKLDLTHAILKEELADLKNISEVAKQLKLKYTS
ncbi:MAG: ADP-ribosylation factor-like protein [Promethearchaeota archaeon]